MRAKVERIFFSNILRICIPLGLCGCLLLFLYLSLSSPDFIAMVGLIIAYLIPPAGKETVIPLGIVLGLPWWLVAFTMAFFDVAGALLIVWNFHLSLRLPFLGRWIERMMKGGREFFDNRPWLEKLYFAGLILFVMIPFESSGGVSGAVLGQMMGMRKQDIVMCVTAGAFLSCFAIAIGADYIRILFEQDLMRGLIALVLILFIIGIAFVARYVAGRRMKGGQQTR